ncbi:MAG: hypothetical protein QF534_01415 [Phycisphaerales bacterium]|nr:hypothetical protein [Phycisphaerales bacterium]
MPLPHCTSPLRVMTLCLLPILMCAPLTHASVFAQESRVENPTPAANDKMGSSLAAGASWLAAGAPRDTTWGTYTGEVAIFPWDTSTGWGTPFTITESTLGNFAYYGTSVAANNDDDRLVVGCPGYAVTSSRVGAAWIYDINPTAGSASFITMLSPAGLSSGDDFGYAVAIYNDYIAVGAPDYNDTGAVWIYQIDSNNDWVQQMVLQPSDLVSGSEFGFSLAMHEDRLVIGAPGHSAGGQDAGRVYVYDLINTTWTTWGQVADWDGPAGARLGEAVDVLEAWVVAGAPEESTNLPMSGRVHRYLYNGRTDVWSELSSLEGSGSGDRFGAAVSCRGDRTLIGAPGEQTVGTDVGRAYLFHEELELAIFEDDQANGYDEVGASVHLASATAFAGAPGAAAGNNQNGGVVTEWDALGTPGCPGDHNVDLVVDADDLETFLKNMTVYPTASPSLSDLDDNAITNVVDLLELLAVWGSCP